MTLPLALFDFDGVIMDSLDAVVQNFLTVGPKYGIDWIQTHSDVCSLLDKNFFESCDEVGIDPVQLQHLFDDMKERIFSNEVTVNPFPHIPSFLKKVSKQYRLSIVSSNDTSIITHHLKRHNLHDYFHEYVGGDTHRNKSHGIKRLLAEASQEAADTFFIGDTCADIIEGKEVGVKTVAVLWGYHNREKLMTANPDYIVDSSEELAAILGVTHS